jgi:hypothetical protein
MFDYLLFLLLNLTIIIILMNQIKYIWIIPVLYILLAIINNYFYNKRYVTTPLWEKNQLIDYVTEGDIIFTNYEYIPYTKTLVPGRFFNGGLAHAGIIIVEQNEKYIVHSVPDKLYEYQKKDILLKHKFDLFQRWETIKQPLSEFIANSKKISVYTIYRCPTKNKIKINYKPKPVLFNAFYYCTLIVGDTLVDHNYIKPSTSLLFRHVSDDLVQELLQNNYKPITLRC